MSVDNHGKIEVSVDIHGKTISIESGRIARQASGSVIVRCGESVVLVTACMGPKKEGIDFLPLTIDYVEKTYAAGKIPGGFFKREGKLTEKEILVSRLMDRPCRPLFPEGFTREIQVVATVISADNENDTDVLAVCGVSAALTISELPFEGPIAAVRIGRVAGKLVVNPTMTQRAKSDLHMIVAGSKDAIVMVEGGAAEFTEAEMCEALFFAHKEMQPLIAIQDQLQQKVGKKKIAVEQLPCNKALVEQVSAFLKPLVDKAIRTKDKLERRTEFEKLSEALNAKFVSAEDPKAENLKKDLKKVVEETLYTAVRTMITKEGVRIDGRNTTTVRPIWIEAGILPRAHGSSLFTRGETQSLVAATLGTSEEAQRLDNLLGETSKTFMLHYNFPPFSVGETKPMRGPGRREIGHGALAERAVKAIMPDEKAFPYVIRIVSEILESNGSSSMATVCGASLALMDAGVPIKAPVAGVAMGLINEDGKFAILTDILGDEDHLGDMDFKVCGTEKGITALQMDIKVKGLDSSIMEKALTQARDARLHILKCMNEALPESRTKLSRYAPRIVTLKISQDKIRDVIGPGGKMIRSITESCGVKIEVSDDGTVKVCSADEGKIQAAINIIQGLTQEAVVGQLYKGIVKRIAEFGAFVEILPGTDGLVHITQLAEERVRRVEDIVQEGDEVWVKVLDVDRQGKIRLSLKEAVSDMANNPQQQGAA